MLNFYGKCFVNGPVHFLPMLTLYGCLGMSYSTALGATIAAMFPDRIRTMILDANLNPHEYYNTL